MASSDRLLWQLALTDTWRNLANSLHSTSYFSMLQHTRTGSKYRILFNVTHLVLHITFTYSDLRPFRKLLCVPQMSQFPSQPAQQLLSAKFQNSSADYHWWSGRMPHQPAPALWEGFIANHGSHSHPGTCQKKMERSYHSSAPAPLLRPQLQGVTGRHSSRVKPNQTVIVLSPPQPLPNPPY